jgi:hypothetical protein
MTEEEQARLASLSSEAESLGLSMRKSDSEGLYYLAKEEALSGESHRVGPDMGLEDVAGFLKEESAVRAALQPTCWLVKVPAGGAAPNGGDILSVIVEVIAKEADAPELACQQANRFVEANYGGRVPAPAAKSLAISAQKPDRDPDGHSPEPLSCPVWIVHSNS